MAVFKFHKQPDCCEKNVARLLKFIMLRTDYSPRVAKRLNPTINLQVSPRERGCAAAHVFYLLDTERRKTYVHVWTSETVILVTVAQKLCTPEHNG